jgi:hypothetical protein
MFTENQTHEMGVKAGAAEAGQYTMEPGVLAYYEVCEVLNKNQNMKVYWHPEHDVPYAYKPGLWIGFDSLESLVNKVNLSSGILNLITKNLAYFKNRIKVNYVKKMELGGVIVWSLDMDDKTGTVCNQGKYPVLNTLKTELTKPDPTSPKSKSGKVSSFPRGFWSKINFNYYRISLQKTAALKPEVQNLSFKN